MEAQCHISLVVLVLASMASSVAADDHRPSVGVTAKRGDDRVELTAQASKVVVSVHCPFGISHAVIERTAKKWPDAMVLRLHLKGLENFRITNGKVRIEGSTSLEDGKPVVRLWMDGKEDLPLDAKSPYWMDVRILEGDGELAKEIPLWDGCFEIVLPKALLGEESKSITVSWIDFYRG